LGSSAGAADGGTAKVYQQQAATETQNAKEEMTARVGLFQSAMATLTFCINLPNRAGTKLRPERKRVPMAGPSHVTNGESHFTLAANLHHWLLEAKSMLYYALVFLLIALVAGMLGFGVIAVAFAGLAKIFFFIFLVLFLVSIVTHLGTRV